jgi:hypothetical protein
MIARAAIIFAGLVLCGVFLNVYFIFLCFITVFLLGIKGEFFFEVQRWICLIAGAITAFYVLRPIWPKQAKKDVEATAEATSNEQA